MSAFAFHKIAVRPAVALTKSSKSPGDIVFRLFLVRVSGKSSLSIQTRSIGHVKERGKIGDRSRLLHVVPNDDYRVLRFQS
jgi:hypothetical protein